MGGSYTYGRMTFPSAAARWGHQCNWGGNKKERGSRIKPWAFCQRYCTLGEFDTFSASFIVTLPQFVALCSVLYFYVSNARRKKHKPTIFTMMMAMVVLQLRAPRLVLLGIISLLPAHGFVPETKLRHLSSAKGISSSPHSTCRRQPPTTETRCSAATDLRIGLFSDASMHLSALDIDDGMVTTMVAVAAAGPVVVSPEPIHTLFTVATFAPQPFFVLMILFRNSKLTKTIMGGLGWSIVILVCAIEKRSSRIPHVSSCTR
jgi:hypothetical protein